jgi:hypothetical protein
MQATFSNGSLLQMFVAAPMTADSSMGALVPPLVLPSLHLDLAEFSIKARIQEIGKDTKRPAGDELVSTHEYIVAVHQGLEVFLPGWLALTL